MDEFYRKIQVLLMKKNKECGEIKFLTTCTTPENEKNIEDVCASVIEVFKACEIPTEGTDVATDERCIRSYMYLLLNTNFKSQERLAEDMVNGHLVDMFPPLSPYLFVQILWRLGYENILVSSVVHLPFDLCAEILEIVRKCVEELPFDRAMEVLYGLILNTYQKFFPLKTEGIQSEDIRESAENLVANFQELMLLLTNPKIVRFEGLPDLKKYERSGILLKRLIHTIKQCLEEKPTERSALGKHEELYKITFGREDFVKWDDVLMEEITSNLNQELTSLLLKKIKEIDCNVYLGWAELDDKDNCTISLQRSIGNDCYRFIEFMKNNAVLSRETHLIECLEQISSKPQSPDTEYVLSLQELCHLVKEGSTEHFKELMCRYKEWDGSIVDFVHENKSLLNQDDCFVLLEYLTFVLGQKDKTELQEHSYSLIMKIILLQSIPDIYKIVMRYVMKHDGKNLLEAPGTMETFHGLIKQNLNLRTPKNLRIILMFILKNIRAVLTTLVRISIGDEEFSHTMISADEMLLLVPFMQIKEENNQVLLINVLRTVCLENAQWTMPKFMDFVRIMVDRSTIKADDLLNNVFIPYLESNTFNSSNLSSILISIRKLQDKFTRNANVNRLVIAIGKRMSLLRKDRSFSRFACTEMFSKMTRLLEYYLDAEMKKVGVRSKREIISGLEAVVEPIDKIHFGPLWSNGISIIDIIEDYERRCFTVVNKLKDDVRTSERLGNYLSDLSFLREDFLRHVILDSNQTEYHKFGTELTLMFWFVFGWNDELDACSQFLRLTMEACCVALEYPSIGPKDLFVFLLKCFTRFCKVFVRLEGMKNPDEVHRSMIKSIDSLEDSVKHSPYANSYDACRVRLKNDVQQDSPHRLQEVLKALDGFSERCGESYDESSESTPSVTRTPKITNFYTMNEVITVCLKAPAREACECIYRLNDLFARD